MQALLLEIEKVLFPDEQEVELLIPYTDGQVYNNLAQNANILETEYQNEGTYVKAICSLYLANLYAKYSIKK